MIFPIRLPLLLTPTKCKLQVTVSAILSTKWYSYMRACVLFRKISEIELFHCTLYRRTTRHVVTRVAKFIDVDGGIFENTVGKLYQLCHVNNKYRY
jgi:hypothetical protein